MSASEQQLLGELKENFQDFKCSLQDLRNPTEDFVVNFYSYFLQEFEADINNINQTQFSQSSVVSAYHDAYSAVIPKINMLKCIRAFNIVRDFGMLDIVSPSPKRTQEIIRAFINFYCWSDQRVSNVREKKVKFNERQNMMTEMRHKKEHLRGKLNSVTKDIPTIRDAKTKIEAETAVMQQNLADLRVEKNTYKEKSDEVENKIKEKENILQKLNRDDVMVISKIKDCSSQIVESPSAVLSEVEVLRHSVEEVSELRDQKRNMVEKKMESKELLEKTLENHRQKSVLLEELMKVIDQLREIMQVGSALETNLSESQENLKELKATLLARSTSKQNCQEKLQALYLKWKTLKPQVIEHVESALNSLKNKKNEKNKMKVLLKEDTEVQEKIDLNMQRIKTSIKKLVHDYQNLQIQSNIMYENMIKGLENNMTDLENEVAKKYKEGD